jgi:hypothetical protein
MIQCYEYIRIRFDWGDLDELNRLSVNGWKIVLKEGDYLLLERPLSQEGGRKALEYFRERAGK